MSSERNRKFAVLANELAAAGINASASSIERLLNRGAVDVKEPPPKHGELGAGTVKVGDDSYPARLLWAGEPGDMMAFYVSLGGEVSGTALPEQVTEYHPYGDLSGTWVTREDIDQLGNSLGPSYETLNAETVARLIRNWARDLGVNV